MSEKLQDIVILSIAEQIGLEPRDAYLFYDIEVNKLKYIYIIQEFVKKSLQNNFWYYKIDEDTAMVIWIN